LIAAVNFDNTGGNFNGLYLIFKKLCQGLT